MLLKSCVGLSPQVAELMLQPSKIPSARPLALLQRCVWVLGRDQHQPGVWRSSSVIHWTTATRQSLSSEYSVPFPVSKWPRRVLDALRSPLAGPSESGEHLQYALPLGRDDLVRDLVRAVFPSPLAPRTSKFYASYLPIGLHISIAAERVPPSWGSGQRRNLCVSSHPHASKLGSQPFSNPVSAPPSILSAVRLDSNQLSTLTRRPASSSFGVWPLAGVIAGIHLLRNLRYGPGRRQALDKLHFTAMG